MYQNKIFTFQIWSCYRYKLSFLAADETIEARFFCHDIVARQIIRRNCDSLLRAINYAPGLPQQILNTIGRRYTFAVGLTDELYCSMEARAYLVDSCVFRPNPQVPAPPTPLALEAPPQAVAQQPQGSSTPPSSGHIGASVHANHLRFYFMVHFL